MVRVLVFGLCVVLGCDGTAEPTATAVEAPPQAERSVDASPTPAAPPVATELRETGEAPPVPRAPTRQPDRTSPSSDARPSAPTASPPSCCRTCKAGKACGDACIAKTDDCTKPPGCACDG